MRKIFGRLTSNLPTERFGSRISIMLFIALQLVNPLWAQLSQGSGHLDWNQFGGNAQHTQSQPNSLVDFPPDHAWSYEMQHTSVFPMAFHSNQVISYGDRVFLSWFYRDQEDTTDDYAHLVALDLSTGDTAWSFQQYIYFIGAITGASTDGNQVYVILELENGFEYLTAFDYWTGGVNFSTAYSFNSSNAMLSPTIYRGMLTVNGGYSTRPGRSTFDPITGERLCRGSVADGGDEWTTGRWEDWIIVPGDDYAKLVHIDSSSCTWAIEFSRFADPNDTSLFGAVTCTFDQAPCGTPSTSSESVESPRSQSTGDLLQFSDSVFFTEGDGSWNGTVVDSVRDVFVMSHGWFLGTVDIHARRLLWYQRGMFHASQRRSEAPNPGAIHDGLLYIADSGLLNEVNLITGERLRVFDHDRGPDSNWIAYPPIIVGNHVVFSTIDRTIAVNLATWQEVWSYPLGGWLSANRTHLFIVSEIEQQVEVFRASPTSIGDDPVNGILPLFFTLGQNYPNPFNPETQIHFWLSERTSVRLEVFNALGRYVTTLTDYTYPAGTHTIDWDGRDKTGADVASGVYLYRLSTPFGTKSRKMLLLR